MEKPDTWYSAFRALEGELYDARNMAEISAFIIDSGPDPKLLAFAVNHTATLTNDLLKKWNKIHDEMRALKTS
jgi:hypothetical protein